MTLRIGKHNLALLAETTLERRGDYPALLFEGKWHSSVVLQERTATLAGGLIELGVRPGDRVLVIARNCPEVILAYQATWRAGAVVVPAIFMLSAAEIAHVLRDSDARVVLAEPELVEKVRDAAARIGGGVTIVTLGEHSDDDVVALSAVAATNQIPVVPRADDDLAAILYTGGTTGRAKGVMLSHANLWHAGYSRAQIGFAPGADHTAVALPLSHTFGVMVTISDQHWPLQRSTAIMRWFVAGAFVELVERASITDTTLVPAMLQALLGERLEQHNLSSLKSIVSGSAPLPPAVATSLSERLPWVELREGYGLTEASALVATTPRGGVRRGSVGRPVPGAEVEIRDASGASLPTGELGEICCRSRFVMSGYWRSPETTAEAVRDGWLYTGDIGRLDADGYLFIVDRKKDLIIRGGFNVHPRDVEEAMLVHPDVAEVSVVGRPDEARGEEVVAFVVPSLGKEPQPAALVDWAREQIGGYRYPREVHVTSRLPRTSIGKIDRKALRDMAAATDGSRT